MMKVWINVEISSEKEGGFSVLFLQGFKNVFSTFSKLIASKNDRDFFFC
jgi:hypothetical protein